MTGGCIDTFWTNPQYSVEVIDADEGTVDKTGTLIVALMQKERRKKKRELGLDLLTIGYSIYKVNSLSAIQHNRSFRHGGYSTSVME